MSQKGDTCPLVFLLWLECFHLTIGHVITSAPVLRFTEPASVNLAELQGQIPNPWLGKRGETNCDGVNIFFCPTVSGTCYTAGDGFIGCCSVSSCAPRTTCIDFTNDDDHPSRCNPDTGGCIACSKELPACVTMTNVLEDQYIMYCDTIATTRTVSYKNLRMGTSTASPSSTSSAAASSTITAAASTKTVELEPNPSSTSTITVTSSTPSPTAAPVGKGHIGPGVIAGIAIAAAFGIAIMSALIFFFFVLPHKRRKREISEAGGFSSDKPSIQPKSPSHWATLLWGRKSPMQPSNNVDTGLGISTNLSDHRDGAHPTSPELPGSPRSSELPSEADGESPRQPLHPYYPATAYQSMPTMAEESPSIYPMVAPPLQQQLRPQSRQQQRPNTSQYMAYSPHHHNSLPISEMSTPTSSMLEANRPTTGFAIDSGFGNTNYTGNVDNAVGHAKETTSGNDGSGETINDVGDRDHRVSATGWEGGYITPETMMAGGWRNADPGATSHIKRS
ncbi:MAG: hypothetical protein M1812_006020 [Candelaria pacifica]|nr:MAG: hypothetical protein M1812_006020 [Candelaria pacifica]